MNFVADENIERALIARLRQPGHQGTSIAEVGAGSADDHILTLASHEPGVVLLSADKDSGGRVFRQGRVSTGVVLIRLSRLPRAERATTGVQVVADYADDLIGAFTTITPGRVRIQRLLR